MILEPTKYTVGVQLTHAWSGTSQTSVTYACDDYAHNEDEGTLTLFGVPLRSMGKFYRSKQVFMLRRVVGYTVRENESGVDEG